jgi:integrase
LIVIVHGRPTAAFYTVIFVFLPSQTTLHRQDQMTRRLVESPITTRSARAALPIGLHWRGIDHDIHLGYRKGRAGGRWLVRWYQQANKGYKRIELGDADDVFDVGTLDYRAATQAAVAAVSQARKKLVADAVGPVPTVRLSVEGYIAARNARKSATENRETKSDAESTLKKHVLGDEALCSTRLDELSEGQLVDWRSALDPSLKASRRRRIANDLKAALNAAHRADRRRLPADFAETIKVGLAAEGEMVETGEVARDNQILDDDIVRQIVSTAIEQDPDLGRMILCLAATGARFSQLRRMKVRDAQLSMRRLLVPHSRKGRNRSAGYSPVRIGPDVIEALRPMVAGRRADEPLLERWRHKQVGPAEWVRDRRGEWTSAAELTRPWAALCEKLGLGGVVPYALRHSSIVRGIAAGLPIRLVAAMHDTSVAMIEKHYSRWIVEGLEDLTARAIIPLSGATVSQAA